MQGASSSTPPDPCPPPLHLPSCWRTLARDPPPPPALDASERLLVGGAAGATGDWSHCSSAPPLGTFSLCISSVSKLSVTSRRSEFFCLQFLGLVLLLLPHNVDQWEHHERCCSTGHTVSLPLASSSVVSTGWLWSSLPAFITMERKLIGSVRRRSQVRGLLMLPSRSGLKCWWNETNCTPHLCFCVFD